MPDRKKTSKKPKQEIDIQQVIIEACTIAEQVEKLTHQLESLKTVIRDFATPLIPEGKSSVKIETDIGKCQVVLVRDHLVMEDGIDAEVLRELIPIPLWNSFFVMKPVFRQTATALFERMPDEQKQMLGDPLPFRLKARLAQVKLPR